MGQAATGMSRPNPPDTTPTSGFSTPAVRLHLADPDGWSFDFVVRATMTHRDDLDLDAVVRLHRDRPRGRGPSRVSRAANVANRGPASSMLSCLAIVPHPERPVLRRCRAPLP